MNAPTNVSKNSLPPYFIQIPMKQGNEGIRWASLKGCLNKFYKIQAHEQFLYIPLLNFQKNDIIQPELPMAKILSLDAIQSLSVPMILRNITIKRTLKDELKTKIPKELHDIIPKSFDIIGSIAIMELNREEQQELRPYTTTIGKAVMDIHPHLTSVYEKAGNIEGDYRTRSLNWVAGEKNTKTKYKENGLFFFIDIQNVFFTPRLSFERARVAQIQSKFNQLGVVWDMFCGVGPFIIQIAKQFPKGRYFGTDINPTAIEFAWENVKLNKLTASITLLTQNLSKIEFLGEFAPLLHKTSRIIMNLPERNLEFIPILPHVIHPQGTLLHIYQFNDNERPLEEAEEKLQIALLNSKIRLKQVLFKRIVKTFSPAQDTTVIDAIIENI